MSESVEQAAPPETVIAMYDLPGAGVGPWWNRRPLFLVVYNTRRVAVVYRIEPHGIVIELRDVAL